MGIEKIVILDSEKLKTEMSLFTVYINSIENTLKKTQNRKVVARQIKD